MYVGSVSRAMSMAELTAMNRFCRMRSSDLGISLAKLYVVAVALACAPLKRFLVNSFIMLINIYNMFCS